MKDNFADAFNPGSTIEEEQEIVETLDEAVDEANEAAEETEEVETTEDEQAPEEETPEETEESKESEVDEDESKQDKPQKMVPLAKTMNLVAKIKAERAEAERARAELAEYRARYEPVQENRYDVLDNPEGYHQQFMNDIDQRFFNERLITSHAKAMANYEQQEVQAAIDWAKGQAVNENFATRLMSQADPVEFAIQQHRESTDIDHLPEDPLEWARQLLAANGELKPAENTQPVVKQAKAKPRSLTDSRASQPGKRAAPVADNTTWEAAFNPRRK